ncbi:hypothetical protein I7V28_19065 [Lelliottia amnigena]|uniref:hypothetical protein n=1 Tax=Lelliottia TaxID=1330545 RepID=UPI00192CA5BA|nr:MULTISPECIES: hypothetical protein [Lelliottia]MBL5885611.1 hypothetical protein [Lelliottia aquatilis]MBL5923183.1 hypothetical protein [Lelliottia amnigena]MBL5932099.1 hypothetical protein [Lelliottia amnigena]
MPTPHLETRYFPQQRNRIRHIIANPQSEREPFSLMFCHRLQHKQQHSVPRHYQSTFLVTGPLTSRNDANANAGAADNCRVVMPPMLKDWQSEKERVWISFQP